uniref:Uncharacterized protein n=1 Tax=Meloidogyne javanica TaxID=6303 RepID=A0A915N075_MELJA
MAKERADDHKEIWQILINRVRSVSDKLFLDEDQVQKVYSRINPLCDEAKKENDLGMLAPFFKEVLLTFEFKSEIITELSKDFEKCSKNVGKIGNVTETLKESKEFPDYMKRMFVITGLAGQRMYNEDIAKRIKSYIESKKYEGLLSLVVIHHGSDLFEILKDQKNIIIKPKIKNDVFGLNSYFSISKTKDFINCYKETEKEYEWELKLGSLVYENQDPRRPLLPYRLKDGPKCSRWYPDSIDYRYGRKPLWSILDEIRTDQELSKTTADFRWNLINNLFLPLPQWRRAETAMAYCKNVTNLENDNLNGCLKILFKDYSVYPTIKRSELLELLIVDKNEALAEQSVDFDILYDIILARPKFELKKIIEIYDSEPEKEVDKVEETDKNGKIFFGNLFWNKKEDKQPENKYADKLDTNEEKVKLGKLLLDKKKADQNNKELWDIIINRVKHVSIMDPSGDENFDKIRIL